MHKTQKYLGLISKLTSSKKTLFTYSELWFRHLQSKLFYDQHCYSSICLNKYAYLCIFHLYPQQGHSESLGFFVEKKVTIKGIEIFQLEQAIYSSYLNQPYWSGSSHPSCDHYSVHIHVCTINLVFLYGKWRVSH